MLINLREATEADGSAAQQSAAIAEGFVLQQAAMDATLDDRQEQITSLLHAVREDNVDRVATDLKRTILTLHVPHTVESAVEKAFEQLHKPIIMRLSPIGAVKNPLKPTLVLSIEDRKAALDALRMLYAEMFTADNLRIDIDVRTAIIMQSMPQAVATYRVINTGEHTIIEAQQGFGAIVSYGESDRFLFHNDDLKLTEPGTSNGIFGKELKEKPRIAITESEAREVLAYAKTSFPASPLLICRLADKTFVPLGSSAALPQL